MKQQISVFGICFILLCYGSRAEIIRTPCPDSISSYPLAVSERYTTNLIFPFAIFQVDLGNGELIGKKMGKAENVLLLKAIRAHCLPTNVSVYLINGALYSFRVTYSDSLTIFNYSFRQESPSAGVPTRKDSPVVLFSKQDINTAKLEKEATLVKKAPGFLHVHASDGKVKLRLKGIYLKDKLLWLSFQAHNRSRIDFEPGLVRFSLEDRKRVRRTAIQSIGLEPVYLPAADSLTGGSKSSWVAGFIPFTIARGKQLVVEWGESGGSRRVHLVIKGKQLLKAKILN